MKVTKEAVFERARSGLLWAGNLIENYQGSNEN